MSFEHTVIEPVNLPSRGLPYGDLIPDGIVKMAPMRTKEEKLLYGNADRVRMLETIVRRCLLSEVMPMEKYLVADQLYMLLAIRNISYGPQYQFKVRCPACGVEFHYDLEVPGGFQVKQLPDGYTEPFERDLPQCKKRVGLKLLRVEDEYEIRKFGERPVEIIEEGDPTYEYRLAKHIATIDGNPADLRESLNLVENMYAMDSSVIQEALRDNDCGADLNLWPVCKRCGTKSQTQFKFTQEFFRRSRAKSNVQ